MANPDVNKVLHQIVQAASNDGRPPSLNGALLQTLREQLGLGQPPPQQQQQQERDPQLAQQILQIFQQRGQQSQQQQQNMQLENLQLRQQVQHLQQQQAVLQHQLQLQLHHQQQQQHIEARAQPAPAASAQQQQKGMTEQLIDLLLNVLARDPQNQAGTGPDNTSSLVSLINNPNVKQMLAGILQTLSQPNHTVASQTGHSPAHSNNNSSQEHATLSQLVQLLQNQSSQVQGRDVSQVTSTTVQQGLGRPPPQETLSSQPGVGSDVASVPSTAASTVGSLNIMSLASLQQANRLACLEGSSAATTNLATAAPFAQASLPRPETSISNGNQVGLRPVSSSETGSNSGDSTTTPTSPQGSATLISHGDAAGVDPSYPLDDIEYPGLHDCMFGRGGGTSNHIGNINFRMLVEKYKRRYAEASKLDKPQVAELVVRKWRSLKPPGRFLTLTNPEEGTLSKWHDVGDKRARRKCAQALREKQGRCRDENCPDEMPSLVPQAKRPRTSN